jgi:hypothetical protein
MVMRAVLYSLFLLFAVSTVYAQNETISIEVSSTNIEKGDLLTVLVKTTAQGDLNYEFPDEFKPYGAPSSGMSSKIKVINGKSIVEKYSYLEFKGIFSKTGSYKIGPFELQTSSGTITSNSIRVEVVKAINMISADPKDNLNQAIFGIIQQSKKEVFIGEPVIVEAKVYTQIDVLQVDDFSPFTFQGPAKKIDVSKQIETKRKFEEIAGRQVVTFEMGRMVFYPELDGTYEISPFEMLLLYNDPRSLFPERAKIRSNESSIRVKPLPANAPVSFNGVVGDFSVHAYTDRDKVDQGKVIAYTIEIEGKGNIESIDIPKIQFPSGAMLYGDPEVEDSIFITSSGLHGRKRITYFLQLNKAKDVTLPSFEFAYFSPENVQYELITIKEIPIQVSPSEDAVDLQIAQLADAPENVEERRSFLPERKMRQDRYTHLFDGWTSTVWSYPVFLSIIFGFFWRVKKGNGENGTKIKPIKTISLQAFNALNEIEAHSSITDEEFFKSVKEVLDNYLVERFVISKLDITRELIRNKTNDWGVTQQDTEYLLRIFDYADSAKYGLIGDSINQKEWLDKAHELIQKLNVK